MTIEEECLNLIIELIQISKQQRKTEYTIVRKKIMKLYHENIEARDFFKKSFKNINSLNIPRS